MATEIILPDGDGAYSEFGTLTPAAPTTHYDKVDDPVASPDDDTTKVATTADGQRDAFSMANPSSISAQDTIYSLTLYVRALSIFMGSALMEIGLRSGGADYWQAIGPLVGVWTTYSRVWTTDPATGNAWTRAKVNAVQGMVRRNGGGANTLEVTQLYIEISYGVGDPEVPVTPGDVADASLQILTAAGVASGSVPIVSGRWSLEMVGGCGDASFVLGTEWDDISQLAAGRHVRVKIGNTVFWSGIVQRLTVEDEEFPRLECVGHRERLRRIGSYSRNFLAQDEYGVRMAGANLLSIIASDVMDRFVGLETDLTKSNLYGSASAIYGLALDGEGYDVLDQIVQGSGGVVIWGVDESKILYFDEIPSTVQARGYFVRGAGTKLTYQRDDSDLLNSVVLIGGGLSLAMEEETYYTYRRKAFWRKRTKHTRRVITNEVWNLLPNGNLTDRTPELNGAVYESAPDLVYSHTWRDIICYAETDFSPADHRTIFRPGVFDNTTAQSKFGESPIRIYMPNVAYSGCTAKIITAYGTSVGGAQRDDARVDVVDGMSGWLSCSVYKDGTSAVYNQWEIETYDGNNNLLQTIWTGLSQLTNGWNRWDGLEGAGAGSGSSQSFALAASGGAVKAKIKLVFVASDAASGDILYLNAWQMSRSDTIKPFSPGMFFCQQYDCDGSYMSAETAEIQSSKTDYGTHFSVIEAPITAVEFDASADGMQYAKMIFRNKATPLISGTLEYAGEPRLVRPWDGLIRLLGWPDDATTELKRFAAETYADMQADRVEYEWDGELRMRISFSSQRTVRPIAGRSPADYPQPSQAQAWLKYLERLSRAAPAHPVQFRRPRR